MADNNQEFIKKDLVYILQLNSQIQYDNRNNVKQAHDMILRKNLFKSVLGKKYLMRLEQRINGADTDGRCSLCKNVLDNPTLICSSCLDKYKLTPAKQDAPAPADKTDPVPDTAAETTAEIAPTAEKPGRPWLFSRVFIAFLAVFTCLYICASGFNNLSAVSGLLLTGAFAVPLSVLTFIFEINVHKNISLFEIMKIFFFGAVTSLILILVLFEVFPIGQLGYADSLIVSLIEACGRLIVTAFFIRQLDSKSLPEGMLIGAATGAGFAVCETTAYALRFFLLSGGSANYLTDILLLRSWSALGSHTAWAAITGAGLAAVKCDKPFNFKLFTDKTFLKFFFIPIILHTIWDCPFMDSGNSVYVKLAGLSVIAWWIIFSQLKPVLNQKPENSTE